MKKLCWKRSSFLGDICEDYRGYVMLVATLKRSFLSCQQLSKVQLKSVIVGDSEIKPISSARAISGHGSILRISPWAFMWAKLAKWSIFHQTDSEVFIGRCYQSPGTRPVTSPPSSRLLQLPVLWHSKIPTWSLAADSTRSCTHCLPVIQVQSHHTIVLCNRLPVPYRIQFKNLLLVHRAIFGVAPVYLKKFLSFKESASYNLLRSNTTYELKVPKTTCKTFGDRVFARVGPPLNLEHSSFRYKEYPGLESRPVVFRFTFAQWANSCTVIAVLYFHSL